MRVFDCTSYGADSKGKEDSTKALQEAVNACSASGGGRVYVPAGKYMLASLELLDNVELYLDRGSLLQSIYASVEYKQIDPELPLRAVVYARRRKNIAIRGAGAIDGQGECYWDKLEKPRTGREDFLEVGASQFWYQRDEKIDKPDRVVLFYRCTDVLIEGIHLTGAAEWTCHLVASDNIKIRGIDIWNPTYGPNTDGIDIDGSSDVLISDCTIHTGDDAIVLKTKNIAKTNHPIRNVTVTNCRFTTGCNALKIGTETQADIENICFSNCTVYSPDEYELIDRCITGIVVETVDGANVRNVVCSNITMINARTAIFIRRGGCFRGDRKIPGLLKGIQFSNIVATGTIYPSVISGLPGYPVEQIKLQNIMVESAPDRKYTPVNVEDIPECVDHYPEVFMFGPAPASALFIRHVEGMTINDCSFSFPQKAEAEEIIAVDAKDLSINGQSNA